MRHNRPVTNYFKVATWENHKQSGRPFVKEQVFFPFDNGDNLDIAGAYHRAQAKALLLKGRISVYDLTSAVTLVVGATLPIIGDLVTGAPN